MIHLCVCFKSDCLLLNKRWNLQWTASCYLRWIFSHNLTNIRNSTFITLLEHNQTIQIQSVLSSVIKTNVYETSISCGKLPNNSHDLSEARGAYCYFSGLGVCGHRERNGFTMPEGTVALRICQEGHANALALNKDSTQIAVAGRSCE